MFKKFVMVCGVLFILYVLSQIFVLKDPDGPRLVNPSDFAPPKVDVRR